MDLVLCNLWVAGRHDVIGLSRQLARTEDKLELVLQEVELLQDELRAARGSNGTAPARAAGDRSVPAPARKPSDASRRHQAQGSK
jgi:hypothetical protein